jgi:hypothetical protein
MNETANVFMTMIEATLIKLIDARIEALRDDTVQNLWSDQAAQSKRIFALEQRLDAIEEHTKNATWAGSANSMATLSVIERIEKLEENAKQPATTATLDLQSEQFRDAVREIADEAVDEHCGEYDHDNIHEDEVDEDAMDTAVRQALKYAYIALK